MKRFSVGFMRSISSSSYEVEMSDNCSHSTRDSVDFNSYSSSGTNLDDEDNKSTTSAYGSNNVFTDDYTFRQVISSEEDRKSGYCAETEELGEEDDDEVPTTLPVRSKSGAKSKRTSSDLSNCTIQSGRAISSSVSSFLSVVDNTVDKVVDALIPLEPKHIEEAQVVPPVKKRFSAPIALKKSLSSFRRKKNDESSVSNSIRSGKKADDRSTSSSRTSFSARSISFRRQPQERSERENLEKNDDSSNRSYRSFILTKWNNGQEAREVDNSDLREKSWKSARQETKVNDQNTKSPDTKRMSFLSSKRNGDETNRNDSTSLNANTSGLSSGKISTGLKKNRNKDKQSTKNSTRLSSGKDIANSQTEISSNKKASKFNNIWKKKQTEPLIHFEEREESTKNESAFDALFRGMGFQGGGSDDSNFLFEDNKKKKSFFKSKLRKKRSEKQHLLQRKTKRGYIRNE